MPCANLGMAISPITKAKHSPMMEMFYTFSSRGPASNPKRGDDRRVRFGGDMHRLRRLAVPTVPFRKTSD